MRPLRAIATLLLLPFQIAFGSGPDKFSQVRIFVQDSQTLQRIFSTGIDHEGVEGKLGGWMKFVAGEFELKELRRAGISYQIEIEDMASFYEQRSAHSTTSPGAFGYGSMGGFYTLAEVLQQLDSLRLMFPSIVSQRDSIGPTTQGRALWMTKIGSAQSAGKPEVLYTALHHAREPQGMMAVLYYMWWLCQNYGTNPEAAYLVNNRQMYFIPVVNPDGYEYNRQTNPNGGGMWRKNRRNNLDGTFGVDPNRNYGPFYMWNAPNGGSSTSTSSDTYRGPSEFSEPENATLDRFMRSHNIKICLNYHTSGNYLIYPWGYLSRENSDSLVYRDWAYDMTAINRYTNGTDQQTVNYSTRGNSDDYMFGDTTKPRTWAMTPEVGTTGFWPTQAEIFPLAIENLQQNKLLAYFAGHYTTVTHHSILDDGANGFLNRGEAFSLIARLKNKGTNAGVNVNVIATSNATSVQFSPTPTVLNPAPLTEYQITLRGTVAANATEGVPVQFYLRIFDPQGFEKIDTLNYFLGTPTIVFADSANSGTGNWTTGTGWGVTSNNHTPPLAFTDSPSGNYATSANNSLTLVNALNLSNYNFAELKFWTTWAIEPTWDFATIEASTNNGATWATLRAPLSHKGSARSGSQQPAGSWGFDSYTPGGTWIEQSVNLSAYVNQPLRIRFRVAADAGDQRDGFYVDDIRVYGYTTSAAPIDTGIVVRRPSFTFNGNIGRLWIDSTIIKNATSSSVTVSIAESSLTTSSGPNAIIDGGTLDLPLLIKRLRPAFQNVSALSFQGGIASSLDPLAYTTILSDARGENGANAADIYRVDYQYRTAGLGNYHDFRFVLGNLPDTNDVALIISVDTDQEFRTGRFPTPLGAGPTSRDVGSEREILIDASGILIDSLIGLRIPAGIVLDVTQDTIRLVGTPFTLSIRRDSVMTIGTETALGGVNASWVSDPDNKMNLGVFAVRLTQNSNRLPDYAPQISHANVGGETGVSWLTEDRTSFTLAANESTYFRIAALGAKPAGTHRAQFSLHSSGRIPVTIPITMNLTTPPNPIITVTPTTIRDTLALGDSVTNALNIRNTGGGQLNFIVADTTRSSWLAISPALGTLDSGQTASVSLRVQSAGLRADTTYTAIIVVICNDPLRQVTPVTLTLRVRRVTSVRAGDEIPVTFALHQNYPNPFNPGTNISFDLPRSSFVSLKIFNVLGQEVATIVNQQLDTGRHSYSVSAEKFGLASGVYLYRILAREYTHTRKMLLTK